MSETIACTPESAVFEAPQLQFNEEGWGKYIGFCSNHSSYSYFVRVALDDRFTWAFCFVLGPCELPDAFKDIPYQPFSKSDRLGKISDWTGTAQTDKKYPSECLEL